MPLLKGYGWQNAVLGKDFEGAPTEEQPVLSEVGPDYFATLGIPIVGGREFTAQDIGPVKYAVINETFAREYFPGRNPIGQRFGLVDDMEPVSPDIEVIGVIPDRKYRDLHEPPAQACFPYLEGVHFRFMNIYLRTQVDPRQIEDELRERMRQFDPHVPVVGQQTMNEQIGFSLRTERLVASLSGVFGRTRHFTRGHRALWGHGLRCNVANARNWNPHCGRSVAEQRDCDGLARSPVNTKRALAKEGPFGFSG
jgi:hypothetical protein